MITLDALTKDFGPPGARVRVLDAVSLRVERGEIAAVVGPSGAGKSTLAKCVNLLERPTSGTVDVDGQDLTALDGAALRRARHAIGTVFQGSALLRRRTAAANVALPLECFGVTRRDARRRVAELLDLVGLGERGDAYVSELSGGQQQRVGIARALALRPSVLLADEATSGLDPDTTRSILDLVRRLRDELQLTVVVITHEMDVVRDVADTVHRLDHGRVVESGPLTAVLGDPTSPLASRLLPRRAHVDAEPGRTTWEVGYASEEVAHDWLVSAAAELGEPLGLLGASVEAVRGRSVGRAVISVPAHLDHDRVRAVLGRAGLSAVPTVAAVVRERIAS